MIMRMLIRSKLKYLWVLSVLALQGALAQPLGPSQTESYLKALAPTRQQAYAKITQFLAAPSPDIFTLSEQEQWKQKKDPSSYLRIQPKEYEHIINEVIASEKQHPNHYVLYHGAAQVNMLSNLFFTYLAQFEYDWHRGDFFIW